MKRTLIIVMSMTGWLTIASGTYAAQVEESHRLEPCLNGEVSATGLYPTQAEEDAALAKAQARTGRGQPQVVTVKYGDAL